MKFIIYIIILISFISSITALDISGIAKNTVVYYTYDDGNFTGNDIFDITGNLHNGNNSGATLGENVGIINESISMSTDYVDMNSLLNFSSLIDNQNFTIISWFNSSNLGSESHIFDNIDQDTGRGADIHIDPNIRIQCRHFDGSDNRTETFVNFTTASIDIGEWHHVACVYNGNGSQTDLYLDGNKYNESNNYGFLPGTYLSNRTFGIGAAAWKSGSMGTAEYFAGTLDESIIFNISLTEEQVVELYDRQLIDSFGSQYPFSEGPTDITISDVVCTSCVANITNDNTPTFTLTTSSNGICRLSSNLTATWISMNDTRNFTTTGGTSHTGTIIVADTLPVGVQNISIICNRTDGTNTSNTTFELEVTGPASNATNIKITFNSQITRGAMEYQPDWTYINFNSFINLSGNYTWTGSVPNATFNSSIKYTFDVHNNQSYDVDFRLKTNESKSWWSWYCNNTLVGTGFTQILSNITAGTRKFVNCTLDLIDMSQTYENWILIENNATWRFNYTSNTTVI